MTTAVRISQSDDQKIEEIIDSFTRYGLRDIRVNKENPIAAFILISCLIDQMAAYAYNTQKRESGINYKLFIERYFTNYTPLELWENLRCALVHNYTLKANFGLQSEPSASSVNFKNINVNEFAVSSFLLELETALNNLCKDLRSNTPPRENAILKYNDSPIIIAVDKRFWQYDEVSADYLIKYYESDILGKPLDGHTGLPITSIIKEKLENVFLVKCISTIRNKNYEAKLDVITEQLGLPYPTVVLKEAGLY